MQTTKRLIVREWKRFVLSTKYLAFVLIIACGIMAIYALVVKPIVPQAMTTIVRAFAPLLFLIACFCALRKADKKSLKKERPQ